jgi:hypothetical protein
MDDPRPNPNYQRSETRQQSGIVIMKTRPAGCTGITASQLVKPGRRVPYLRDVGTTINERHVHIDAGIGHRGCFTGELSLLTAEPEILREVENANAH